MSFQMPQVFISSTSEFAAERKQLAEALSASQFAPFIYEEEAASGSSPENHCRKMIEESEIVVLILGSKYGSFFPGRQSSIVEWEYEHAIESEKALKPYVKELPPGTPIDPPQESFLTRVKNFRTGSWVRQFRGVSDLVKYVVDDVMRWRLDFWRVYQEGEVERRRWKDKAVLIAALIVALMTVGGVVGGAFAGVDSGKLALILFAGVATLGALGWLLKSKVL
jgi:hypothetical protein